MWSLPKTGVAKKKTVAVISQFPRILKIVSSACKNHCMHFICSEHGKPSSTELDQSICDHKYFMTTAHLRFQCENLKINLTVFVKAF